MIINGIVFLISLSDSSLLVYRNATSFCILISYPATLSNLLMISRSERHLEDSLCIISCYLITVTVLLLPFQFWFLFFLWFPFLSFSCPIAVVRTFMTMKSGLCLLTFLVTLYVVALLHLLCICLYQLAFSFHNFHVSSCGFFFFT